MKFGMPALIELDTIEENVKFCNELRLDFVELNMNFPYNMIDSIKPEYLRKLSSEYNLEFTMHMPDDADIGSFYKGVREEYLKLFIDTIRWANLSNIRLINMHIIKGAYMTLPDKKIYINEKYSDKYIENFLSSLMIISREATLNNVSVCIENSNNFELGYVQDILDKALLYENINLTWDVGHDYLSNYTDKNVVFKYQNKIKHMHLHDAKKNSDHLALYDGDLNIDEIINFAKKNNLTTLIEVKSKEALIKSAKIIINATKINK